MIYCTSDLHGMSVAELEALLKKASFKDSDFLFVLGDVIDRGDGGVELLKWLLLQPNVEFLLGNHESMLLSCAFVFDEITEQSITELSPERMELLSEWMSNGAEPTLKALRELNRTDPEKCRDILDYLRDAPLYETVSVNGRDFLLCHAGFESFDKSKKLSEYSADEWLWSRPCYDDRFFDDVITVFGHTPTGYFSFEFAHKILKTETWIDIDTGGTPALLRLDDLEEIYL